MDENIVYSKEVIEFTAVANEYCKFIEEASEAEGIKLLQVLQKLLPLLYMKSLYLPDVESKLEEDNEKFVREEDWQAIKDTLTYKFGAANDYVDVNQEEATTEDLVYGDIAENLADIYQDIKDFLMAYRLGVLEIMNDALWECKESFKIYWGQTLVNTIRAVHYALKEPEKLEEDMPLGREEQDKSDWFITRRQSESGNGEGDDV